MIKYIETTDTLGHKVFIKIDAIRCLEERVGIGCVINGDLAVRESYEDVKAIIDADERRVTYGNDMDYRLRQLIRDSLWALYKDFGNTAMDYVKDILNCNNESEIYEIKKKYATKGICPHRGHNTFTNSWGQGNAMCCNCKYEFNISFKDGKIVGEPL